MASQDTSKPSQNSVKVVDFGPFMDGSGRQEVSDAILESFKSIGFVYLANHPIAQEDIDTMFTWSKTLFSRPLETKQLAPHPESGAHHRGYSALGREKVKHYDTDRENDLVDEEVRDVKESFEVGREDMEKMPNIWFPEGVLPGFREACLRFYWICAKAELVLLRALALGLNIPEEYFLPYHSNADNQLRLLHYPSIPTKLLENENASRIPSHSDFCTLTMLMQDDIGGLEVENPRHPGTFIPVPPIPGTIVVNAGDFLMRWSNDTIRSTIHRVRSPPPAKAESLDDHIPSRYSIPYFCGANLSTIVECIPGTWSENRPKKYPPVSAGEYITERLAMNY